MTVALGREEKLFVVSESTYGTAAAAPAATDALRFLSTTFNQAIERVDRADKRNTRSLLERIVRRKTADYSIQGYFLPSGAAGTPPDGWDKILEAAFGLETVNGGTNVIYSLVKDFEKSLTLHRGVGCDASNRVFGEMITGAVVDTLGIVLSGSEEAMINAAGFGSEILRAGTATVVSDDGTNIVVGSGESKAFDAGTYIQAGSTADILIVSIDEGTDTLTCAAHVASSGSDPVSPQAAITSQTFVSTASPISGILGSMTLDSVSFDILAAEINISNAAIAHNDKYGADKTTSYHQGNRSVTGSLTLRLTDGNFVDVARSKNNELRDIALVSGTEAGSIATFDLNQVNIDYTSIPADAVDDVTVQLPFVALGSSGEDEITLTLT